MQTETRYFKGTWCASRNITIHDQVMDITLCHVSVVFSYFVWLFKLVVRNTCSRVELAGRSYQILVRNVSKLIKINVERQQYCVRIELVPRPFSLLLELSLLGPFCVFQLKDRNLSRPRLMSNLIESNFPIDRLRDWRFLSLPLRHIYGNYQRLLVYS